MHVNEAPAGEASVHVNEVPAGEASVHVNEVPACASAAPMRGRVGVLFATSARNLWGEDGFRGA